MNEQINNNAIKEQAAYYLSCMNDGFSSKEEKEFKHWIENTENKKVFDRLQHMQNLYTSISKDVKDEISSEVHRQIKSENVFKKFKKLSIAAAVVMVIGLGIFQSSDFLNLSFITSKSYSTQLSSKSIDLPDGSNIMLDAKTSLSTKYLEDKRLVTLERGNAVFDVKRDINKPFIINSNGIQIKVLGTSFEVKDKKETLEVNVISGLVSVSKLSNDSIPNELSKLAKGKKIIVHKTSNSFVVNDIDVQTIASWKDGMLHFQDLTLKQAVEEFKKYNDMNVLIQKEIEELSISGLFPIDDFEKFLYAIGEIYSLNNSKKGERIYIFKKSKKI